jgi:predicted glycoside hydrolase/deacetylase ChbG (UPF0249 family)
MIIINADDLGRSTAETDATAELVKRGRLTSVSAMVFMKDSERAAEVAGDMTADVGLHLNFCESWSSPNVPKGLAAEHEALVAFFNRGRYARLVYNPLLRRAFQTVYAAQVEEFERLYGRAPSHTDGHRHLHLCPNMLIDCPIPYGSRVRRNFTFDPYEKGSLNRLYRRIVDAHLGRRYELTDYFFSLAQCLNGRSTPLSRVADLSKSSIVEIMVHPKNPMEFNYLIGDKFPHTLNNVGRRPWVERCPGVLDRALGLGTLVASVCEWPIPIP